MNAPIVTGKATPSFSGLTLGDWFEVDMASGDVRRLEGKSSVPKDRVVGKVTHATPWSITITYGPVK